MKVQLRPIKITDKYSNEVTLPYTMKLVSEDTVNITSTFAPSRGHGVYVLANTKREAKRIIIGGSLYQYGKENVDSLKDEIVRLLVNPPIELEINERILFCYPDGETFRQLDNFTELLPEFRLLAADPFWYGEEEEEAGGEIVVGGNYMTAPLLTVSGAAAFTVTSSLGYTIALTGMTSPVVINCKAMTIADASGNKTGSASDAWLKNGFWLHPGAQTVTTDAGTLTVKYRDCYA